MNTSTLDTHTMNTNTLGTGSIHKAAVIGAGVMGAGIAAHLANAGLEVILLDIDKANADTGVARQLKAGGFMDPAFAARLRTGAVATDLPALADADWIIEAIAEKREIKQALYREIDAIRKPGSIVSSNTSTIPLAALTADMPERFCSDFLITHFFNPPRIMRLLELITGPQTRQDAVTTISRFADQQLGKTVVRCKDTPGFIGNRIGNYWMVVAQNEAIRLGLDVEEADAIISRPFGIPATGIFGLLDLVGIDLMPTLLRILQQATPAGDAIQACDAEPPLIARMIRENRLGRKSGAGFVRLSADRRQRDVTDLATGEYRPQRAVASDSLQASRGNPRALMEHPGRGGQYAAAVMEQALAYAAALVPEIADTPFDVDEAMRNGYGWKEGPFELMDRLGTDWLAQRLQARGLPVPAYLALAAGQGGFYSVQDGRRACLLPDGSRQRQQRAPGVLLLGDLSLARPPAARWETAELWDLGDGVAGLAFRTKMNTFNPALLETIQAALAHTRSHFRALVIGSDANAFSAGADLRVFLETLEQHGIAGLERFLDLGHDTFQAVKYAPFPVVGAAAGLALGGGCEILLHCDAIQAHAELSMGLVETRIGVIPGWGGCKEMLLRMQHAPGVPRGPVAPAIAAFNLISAAKVSASAFDARKLGFLTPRDGISMNRNRLLADAKEKALQLAQDYRAPEPATLQVAGGAGLAALQNLIDAEIQAGRASPHDGVVNMALAGILSGGNAADPLHPLTEDALLQLERTAFLDLLATPASQARVRHMLDTGKPLRN
ncbi:3-hydroxyacyl-CoA dehydrogenase [Kerstersia similis]